MINIDNENVEIAHNRELRNGDKESPSQKQENKIVSGESSILIPEKQRDMSPNTRLRE